ncbi:efflux RND transporter periplasmic adaptor subunit [Pendulispora brunnea]|uniref:Efflux RND transporter periplasmic adaptor subunit n=1 Tax=Pendulispora brunnea TaxID=2905690 RepID=A0ABZ2K6E9_9BACT
MFSERAAFLPAILALGLPVLLSGCRHPTKSDPRIDPPLVRTAVVQTDASSLTRSFTGTVAARVQSDLSFRVSGKVLERLVSSGQQVRRGQPLMRLDDVDLKLASNAQEEAVVAAAARARQATDDETRDRSLAADGAVPIAAYDRMKASAEAARAQLKAVQAQATVARNATAYALLVADANGVIVETLAEPGQVVGAGQTVVRLAQHGPREAVVQLPETLRPMLGSSAQAALYGHAGVIVPTHLRELSSAADPLTRTFQAKYVLEGPLADAALGATVTVVVPEDGARHDLRVPVGAVFDPGGGPGVWTILDPPARVTWRPIKVNRIDDDTVSVSEGLKEGDRVVSLGAHILHEGQEVRLDAQASRHEGALGVGKP